MFPRRPAPYTSYPTWENAEFVPLANGSAVTNLQTSTTGTPGSPDDFFIAPPAGSVLRISRILIVLRDDGNPSIAEFGAGTALTNGCIFCVTDDTGSPPAILRTFGTINANDELHSLVGPDVLYLTGTGNICTVAARWTISRGLTGEPLEIRDTERFVCRVQDSLSFLSSSRPSEICVQAKLVTR